MHNRILWLIYFIIINVLLTACSTTISDTSPTSPQVIFVCKHGNVKSLMAATYFNDLAQARNLSYRAISRGIAPDSDSVPTPIISELNTDGFDVSSYSPKKVKLTDLNSAAHIILIGTVLFTSASNTQAKTETWTDVPPASVDYAAARDSIKAHIKSLIDKLESDKSH